MPPPSKTARLPLIVQLIIVAPPKIPPPVLPVLPRIVLLIAVSDPALETPLPQPLPATVFSLMVVFWIVNGPDVVGDAAAKGREEPHNQCLVVVHGGIDDRHGSNVINTGPAVLDAVR